MLSVCRLIVPAAVILAAFASPAWAQFAWSTASPESQGMSTSELDALRNELQLRNTTHLLVIRNDRIVYEWYAPGQSRTSLHYTASMAKSVVGGVSLGVALHDGRIALDDFATKYVASWAGVPLKSQIRIRHLGSHTSGLEDAEADGLSHDQLTGWKGDFWKRLEVPNDPFTIARDEAPALFTAGTSEAYSNPGSAMLTYCVTASLQTAPVKDIRTLLRDRIMRPIGVPDGEWSVGYEQTFTVDGLPLVPSWGGSNHSPNAVARVARLMLTSGTWQTTELLSASSVQAITTNEGTPGNFAQGWRTNSDHTGGTLPADAFWGEGSGHQIVAVVPSLNLIAVRFGENLDPAADWDAAVRMYLFDPLMRAINNAAPGLPTVTTAAATGVTTSGAMLNGSVNPNGLTTTAWFEWGTSPTLATFTATASQAVGSGTAAQAVTVTLPGLSPATTYYYRVAGSSTGGTVKGAIVSFTTGSTVVATTTALISGTNPSQVGQSVTFTATVTSSGGGTPTGTVSFKDSGKVIGTATLSGGQAVFVTSVLKKGSQKITAVYSGNAQFASSTSPVLTQVVK